MDSTSRASRGRCLRPSQGVRALVQAKLISKYPPIDFARRHPLDEPAVNSLLSALTLLRSIRASVLDEAEPNINTDTNSTSTSVSTAAPVAPDASPLFHRSPQTHTRGTDVNMRSCVYIMTFGYATLVLTLHRELTRRASVAASTSSAAGKGAQAYIGTSGASAAQWASERLDVLRRQTHQLAGFALADVARALRVLPSLPHLTHLEHGALVAWAQFCLDEAEAGGVPVTPEQAAIMDACVVFFILTVHMSTPSCPLVWLWLTFRVYFTDMDIAIAGSRTR